MSTFSKLTMLMVVACPTCPSFGEEITRGEQEQKIDAYMTRHAKSGFSGVVFAAKGGQVIISKGYGLANDAKEIPFTPETVFTVGSITKQFTGAAIVKLESQRKLRVTDSIDQYFDNVPEDKRAITLHHLLTHSSGLRDAFGDDFEPVSRDEIIKRAMESKLLWAPGTRYQYSNGGYSLLAAIIEQVTGDTYERYLHDELFKPAGMMHTGYQIPQWDPDQMAHGYLEDGEDWGTLLDHPWADDGPYWNLRGNGGIMSTAEDLFRWHQALNGTDVLSEEAKAKYFAAHVQEGPRAKTYYGYGWVVGAARDKSKYLWHNGGNGIFFADMSRYLGDDMVLIMASNRRERSAEVPKLVVLNVLR
jgi:CubicO group peptidase (beta-lactamase class C family)